MVEHQSCVQPEEVDRRLADETAELRSRIENQKTKVVAAKRQIEELKASIGDLNKEKDQALLAASKAKAKLNEERTSHADTLEEAKSESVRLNQKVEALETKVALARSEVEMLRIDLDALRSEADQERKAAEDTNASTLIYQQLTEDTFLDGIRCAQWDMRQLGCNHNMSQMLIDYDATEAEAAFASFLEARPDLAEKAGLAGGENTDDESQAGHGGDEAAGARQEATEAEEAILGDEGAGLTEVVSAVPIRQEVAPDGEDAAPRSEEEAPGEEAGPSQVAGAT